MPTLNRFTLPEEFYDWTSDMLLLQPEPQYLYASMYKQAMSAELNVPDVLGLAGRGVSGSAPGGYATPDDGRLQLAAAMGGEVIGFKMDFTGKPGSMVRVNRPKFTDTTYTKASRLVASNSTISTTPVNVGSEQVTLMLQRFAGPYDQVNARVAPYGLEAFDAEMGVHKMSKIVGLHMKRDYDKFVESVLVSLLDGADQIVRTAGMTSDNDPTADDTANFNYNTLNRAELALDNANIPTFSDGHRWMVITPKQAMNMKDDAQFARYAQFHPQFNALYPGYITTVNKIHLFKSNTLTVSANSSSVNIHRAHAFGPGVLAAAMGRRPRILSSTDDNYGETGKVIWSVDADWTLADNRFVVSVRTT